MLLAKLPLVDLKTELTLLSLNCTHSQHIIIAANTHHHM